MGGLVAGFHATGKSSAEMEEFVVTLDWEQALDFQADYRDLTVRRKEDQRTFPVWFEMGLRDWEFRLPAGLSAGHQVGLLLDEVAAPYSGIEHFDDLPTPFRSIATDLRSGDRVVFEDGSLALALRATMSLPAIFRPVEYGDMLLVDGGIVGNLPTDIVRDMNTDVVIAVDLGFDTIGDDQILSLVDVADRAADLMIRRNELESLEDADVVVKPEVTGIGMLDFRNVAPIIELGYAAAEAVAEDLRPYALSEEQWQEYAASREERTRRFAITPDFIELTGTLSGDGQRIMTELSRFRGRELDREDLDASLTAITGFGPYAAAGYRVVERGDQTGLGIDLARKSHGPPFIRPLFLLDSGQDGNASFTAAARITAFDVPTSKSEWRTDLSAGRVNAVGSEYYQHLGTRGFFVAPRGFASQENQLIIADGERLADYKRTRAGGGLDVGFTFGRSIEVRTGVEMASLRGEVQIGSPVLPNVRGAEYLWRTRWRFDALNSGSIPTDGIWVDAQLNWQFRSPTTTIEGMDVVNPDKFGQAWSEVIYAKEFGDWSGFGRVLGGGTFGGEVEPFSEFRLGGPLRLGALEVGELRGAHLAFLSSGVLRKFYESPASIIGKVYGTLIYEAGDAFDRSPEPFHSGTVGLMAETGLGILFTGYSYGEQGRAGFFFSFGRIFDSGIRSGNSLR
jgi:NTE family protein